MKFRTGIRDGDRLDDPQIRQFFNFVETILIYKLPHLTHEEIQAMLHWPEIDIKQTRVYQQALAERLRDYHPWERRTPVRHL
jgi:predicted transposase YdaD